MKINNKLIVVLFLFVITLISYINIFQNEFAWDDVFFIEENIHIKDLENIPGFFTEPSPGNLYRPLRSVFYTLNYQIWEINTFGYHLNSILLNFLVAIVLFFITLKITNKTAFSFVVSLFFATHPIHTARITNMTAAFDLYGILFMLVSFLFYIIYTQKREKNYFYLSIISFLLAIFSSEEAITLILILFLYDISFNYDFNFNNVKKLLKKYIPFILITAFYLIIRFLVLKQIGRGEIYFQHSFFGTFLTTFKIFIQYIIILFLPINLTIERYVKFETSLLSINFLISLFLLLVILFFFIKSYKRSKIMFFSIGWFFITLLPFSNIFPQITIMADRYLYLSSYGFVLLLTFLIFKINKIKIIKKYANVVIILIVILLSSFYVNSTIQRNSEWKDNYTILSSDAEKNPFGTRIQHALALHYRENKDYETALAHANRAVELASKNYNAYENLGTINAYQKNYDDAIIYYNKAIELNPKFYLANNNLGLVYSYISDFNNSVLYLKKAIEINPKLSKAHNDLGTVYANMGEIDLAINEIKVAIELNPYEIDYYYNIAIIYEFLENNEDAMYYLNKGLEIDSENEKINKKLESLR